MNVVRLDGRDLSASLVHGREPAPRDVYAETLYPRTFGWSDLGAVRRDGKKLISGKLDELFDLDRDPHETRNILKRDRATFRELAAALIPNHRRAAAQSAPQGVVTADPRSMIAQFNEFEAATSLLAEPDAGRALPRLKALVSQAPDNLAFRLELAHAYELSGDRASAVRIDRENVTLAPNEARGWMNLAGALMRQGGDMKEARSAVQESLRLDPNRSEAHNILGVLLALSGEPEEAATEFRRAVAIDPRNAQAYNNLGESLRGVGDTAGALNAYRRAIELAPGFEAPRNSVRALLAQPRR
jgi:Flp pilus assembly protein TadD